MKVPRTRMRRSSKTFRRIPKVATKVKKTMDKIIDTTNQVEDFREAIADKPIGAIAELAGKLAAFKKTPVGVTGLSLMPPGAREAVMNNVATNGVTSSATMYMYRPPRKRDESGILNYQMKTLCESRITTSSNLTNIEDMNILDAEPVLDNPDSNSKYSNLTIRKAFDKLLLSRQRQDTSGTTYDLKQEQTSIHFKTLNSELVLTNNSSDTAMIDIYELVPQHDLGPTTYESETRATGYMSPRWTVEQGMTTANVLELEDNINALAVALNPFNSTTFSRTWKVVKRLRVNLAGYATHRHKSIYQINKTVSYQKMAQVSTSGGKFEGWNPTFFIQQKGVPKGDLFATASDVTYMGNFQLNYCASSQEQARVIIYDDKT